MADGIAVFKAGKLQQLGQPLDLYKRPATKFVADFIGESNFLKATVISVSNGSATVNTAVGPLIAQLSPQSSALSPNTSLLAAFRPESISVHADGAANGANSIRTKRLSTVYLGEMAEHILELPNGDKIKAFELNPNMALSHAPTCTISIPPENLMLVPAES
jgi:ABC-type Fe3+/spermidine/putrescine transport system ATPase subunit